MKRLFLLACLLLLTLSAFADEADHLDHEELRALMKGVTTAVNTAKFSDLQQFFHKQLRVTTINQEIITKPEGLEPYFKEWVGPGKYVETMQMTLEADDVTEFYGTGEGRFGVVRGSGTEDYALKDGRHLPMKTRWTATVMKDGGKWKILALHIGANFYRNPIVEQFQAATKLYGAAGFGVGLLVGGGLVFMLTRRRG